MRPLAPLILARRLGRRSRATTWPVASSRCRRLTTAGRSSRRASIPSDACGGGSMSGHLADEPASAMIASAHDLFDNAVDPRWADEFPTDSRHRLAVAIDCDLVAGKASVCYA